MTDLDDIVIVGTFQPTTREQETALNERAELMKQIIKMSVSQRRVREMWPRDTFVFHNGCIHKQSQHGNYADGGFLYTFDGLVMCSRAISDDTFHLGKEDACSSYAERRLKLWRLYHERADVLPSPNLKKNPNIVPHIDYVVLPVPQRNVLFVDEDYFLENEKDIRSFCSRRGFAIETVYNDYENPSWPCNSLVLQSSHGLIAFVNQDSDGRFIYSLQHPGIKPIEIPFSTNCSLGGGIHCATNTVPRAYIDKALELFHYQ